ncbi:MAG: S8 family serine peptidase [Bdellovibrio sp.]|nr:S8 family serine peptidase [Bdellovibrio sp.]
MKKINLRFKSFIIFTVCALVVGCGFKKFEADLFSQTNADPLFKYAWHLLNVGQAVFSPAPAVAGYDLNLSATWNQQIYGRGVVVQVSDDGLEDTHEDLNANFPYLNISKNYTLSSPFTATSAAPIASDDNHGTSVAGLIAAVGWNKVGTRGVAPQSQLTVANFLSGAVSQSLAKYVDQAGGSFDISNMSWGGTQNTIDIVNTTYNAQLKSMITTKRGGKGAIFVKAAGNDFTVLCNGSTTTYCVGNSNFDSDNVIPYMIPVAAMNALGISSSYSSTGSSVWITAFGGEFGSDSPAMITTDRMGCTNGFSNSNRTTAFENGTNPENSGCNYTSTFNGTSAAAPVISGVVALLLQTNPNLSWREVKYILAKTATADHFVSGSIAHPLGSVLPSGYVWEQKWITNAASFKFHNWYGFGRVNVDAAVAMAKNFITTPSNLGTFTETNWAQTNSGLALAISDNNATGVTNSIVVPAVLTVEAVQIKVNITHADISELALELTSPSGTKSILMNARNSLTGIANLVGETFLSNAFYQEPAAGTWTLRVIDAKSGITGTLTSFSINIFGGAH